MYQAIFLQVNHVYMKKWLDWILTCTHNPLHWWWPLTWLDQVGTLPSVFQHQSALDFINKQDKQHYQEYFYTYSDFTFFRVLRDTMSMVHNALNVLRPFCRPTFWSCVNLIISKRMFTKNFSGSEKVRNWLLVTQPYCLIMVALSIVTPIITSRLSPATQYRVNVVLRFWRKNRGSEDRKIGTAMIGRSLGIGMIGSVISCIHTNST